MVVKYGFNVLTMMFIWWPILSLIFRFRKDRNILMNLDRHTYYPVDEEVNGSGIFLVHLGAYLTLYLIPTLQIASWEIVIVFVPLVTFLFASNMYHERLGAILAQSRFGPAES
jgi:hypothetical protein